MVGRKCNIRTEEHGLFRRVGRKHDGLTNVFSTPIFGSSLTHARIIFIFRRSKNSLPILVLVLRVLPCTLEEQSEEEERLQVYRLSWVVKTCPRMMSHCRKRKMTQSSRSWRRSRRIPPGRCCWWPLHRRRIRGWAQLRRGVGPHPPEGERNRRVTAPGEGWGGTASCRAERG